MSTPAEKKKAAAMEKLKEAAAKKARLEATTAVSDASAVGVTAPTTATPRQPLLDDSPAGSQQETAAMATAAMSTGITSTATRVLPAVEEADVVSLSYITEAVELKRCDWVAKVIQVTPASGNSPGFVLFADDKSVLGLVIAAPLWKRTTAEVFALGKACTLLHLS